MCRLLVVRSQDAFDPRGPLPAKSSLPSPRTARSFRGTAGGAPGWIQPVCGRSTGTSDPCWEDDFSPFPSTTLLVAHARSAFEDKDIWWRTTCPSPTGKAVFIFNGELRGVKIKEEGRIGAEKIFNFIRRFDSGDTLAALKKATAIIRNRTRYIRGMNIIMVKDRTIYLSTFFQGDAEYFTMHCKENRELILCSEAFPSEEGWQGIANDTIREW